MMELMVEIEVRLVESAVVVEMEGEEVGIDIDIDIEVEIARIEVVGDVGAEDGVVVDVDISAMSVVARSGRRMMDAGSRTGRARGASGCGYVRMCCGRERGRDLLDDWETVREMRARRERVDESCMFEVLI